jgi:hypothetical protein
MSLIGGRVLQVLKMMGLCIMLVAADAKAQQPDTRPRQFLRGQLSRINELPSGRFRMRIESLPASAQARALQVLRRLHFTELDLKSLETDPEGGIYYVDMFPPIPAGSEEETGASSDPVVSQAAAPVNPFPASLIFHSKPGAPNVVFLHFSGETVTNTAWNTSVGRTAIPAVAFSIDSDFTTYSDAEQTAIQRIWLRVAEDYAPFDVDVTTERPAILNNRTAMALITRSTDANGNANPSSTAGGVAYVSVFGIMNYSQYRPAWIYYNNLATTESYIAEAASHEIGHNLGLSHDGKTDGTDYYNGHGSGDTSWGPIMGTGYNRNVSQWCRGEYYMSNNTQDDLATIASYISYRADDHGDTQATATSLVVTGGTNVVSTKPDTDPDNLLPMNKGILEYNTDVDVFSFITGNGPINLTVNPWLQPASTRGGNLDVLIELHDESGTLLMTNNPASQTQAQIQTNLARGRYYIYIRGTGTGDPIASTPTGYTSYGSVGQYFISGALAPVLAPPTNLRELD